MEDTNIEIPKQIVTSDFEIDWKRIIMFGGIIIILLAQCFIVYKIYDRQDIYDDAPLFYGAKKYGLEYCECSAGENRFAWFNQTTLTMKTKNSNYNNFQNFNFSLIKLKK